MWIVRSWSSAKVSAGKPPSSRNTSRRQAPTAPGTTVVDSRVQFRAEVKADGTLSYRGNQGSIHRLGAIVQGKTACNGWTFWHFEADGKLKPIDLLREEAKRQLGLGAPAIIAAE